MKRHWMLLITLGFLLATVAGYRTSIRSTADMRTSRQNLQKQIAEADRRTKNKAVELKGLAATEALADEITHEVRFEPDCTRMLQWFADAANDARVRLLTSKVLPPDSTGANVAGGAYRRQRFELTLEGGYAPLVQYIECVERSPHPMIIENFALTAESDRKGANVAGLRLVISSLTPAPAAAQKKGATP